MIDKKFLDSILKVREQYISLYRKEKEEKGSMSLLADRAAAAELIDASYSDESVKKFLQTLSVALIADAAHVAEPATVAFLGPEGTFTSQAVINFFGEGISRIPQKTIGDVFRQVEAGDAAYGVVPVENSTEGAVTFTLDELMETDLNITAEQYMKISMCLIGKNIEGTMVKRIYSHPQPVGQCKGWLRKNYPDAELVIVDSTTRAAENAAEDNESAAIAAEVAASIYNLDIISKGIEDLRQNATRFFAIGNMYQEPTGNDKTSLVCAIKDKPAALSRLLEPFNGAGINMTKIESRPDKKKMWEYNFFIDFLGHRDDEIVIEALEKMKEETIFLKVLGSYPVGK